MLGCDPVPRLAEHPVPLPWAPMSSGHFRGVFLSVSGRAVPPRVRFHGRFCTITTVSAKPKRSRFGLNPGVVLGWQGCAAGQGSKRCREQGKTHQQDVWAHRAFRERQSSVRL